MLAWLQVSRTMVTLLLAVVLLGAGYVVGTTYGPIVTTKVFGNKCYDRVIPLVFGMRCVGLGVGVLLLPSLAEQQGDWTLPLMLAIGMMVVAIIMGLLAMQLAPMRKLHQNGNKT